MRIGGTPVSGAADLAIAPRGAGERIEQGESEGSPDLVAPGALHGPGWWLLLVGYPLLWLLGYQISTEYWFVPAGLRLAALLRLPQRQWAALFVAEVAAVAGYEWVFGVGYERLSAALLGIAAPFAAYAVAVAAWRRLNRSARGATPGALAALMVAVLGAALLVAVLLTIMRVLQQTVSWQQFPLLLLDYAIGDYIAALIVAPLLIQLGLPRPGWMRAGLLRSVLLTLLPLVLLLAASVAWFPQATAYFALLAMIPPVWMAYRGGWRGAAMALAGSSVAVYAFTPASGGVVPPSVLQMFLAVVGSVALMLGAWVASEASLQARLLQNNALLLQVNRRLEAGSREMRDLGQRLVHAQETERSRIRGEISGDLGQAVSALAGQLSLLARRLDSPEQFAMLDILRLQMQQVRDVAEECIERLQPTAVDRRELAAALSDSALARSLEQVGVDYRVTVSGNERALDADARLAIYRVVQHVVAAVLRRGDALALVVRVEVAGDAPESTVEVGCELRFRSVVAPLAFSDQADVRALYDRLLALGGECDIAAIDPHALRCCARFPLNTGVASGHSEEIRS